MKILVCIDGSDYSLQAAETAAGIAAGLEDTEVTLINVDEVIPDIPYFSEESLEQMEKRNREEREKILAEAVEVFADKNVKVQARVIKGNPAATIVELAEEGNYDLVVIGSRGLGGFKQALLGSVSNAVAQAVKTSVLIIK